VRRPRNAELEARVLSIVGRLRARQPIEDRRVELKRGWIDPAKAARRLAGHANAARGDDILWVVGLDEGASEPVVGADETEFSVWHSQVTRCFIEMVPTIESLNVPVDGVTLVALLIDSSRAPYVVKNPAYGLPGGGAVEYEVPWREATSIRSARRSDLLRLLVPVAATPIVQVLDGEVELRRPGELEERFYNLSVNLYLRVAPLAQPLIFPDHDAEVIFSIGNEEIWLRECKLTDCRSPVPMASPSIAGSVAPSPVDTSQRGHGQLVVHASGPLRVLAHSWPGMGPEPDPTKGASARITTLADGHDTPVVIEVDLPNYSLRRGEAPVWTTANC